MLSVSNICSILNVIFHKKLNKKKIIFCFNVHIPRISYDITDNKYLSSIISPFFAHVSAVLCFTKRFLHDTHTRTHHTLNQILHFLLCWYYFRLLPPPKPIARFCISYIPVISSFISSIIIFASLRDRAIRFLISTLSIYCLICFSSCSI